MSHPIDRLLDEHRDLMREVAPLRGAIEDLRMQGDAALPAALPALQRVGDMMATRLLLHARKEDEALFPAIERALGAPGGPTTVMREEHREIHAHAQRFRDTLHELNEIEHPAIEAGGERLRALAHGGGGAAELAGTAEAIVTLLDLHFGKEEQILFPMAREVLSRAEIDAVADRMAAIEVEAAMVQKEHVQAKSKTSGFR